MRVERQARRLYQGRYCQNVDHLLPTVLSQSRAPRLVQTQVRVYVCMRVCVCIDVYWYVCV